MNQDMNNQLDAAIKELTEGREKLSEYQESLEKFQTCNEDLQTKLNRASDELRNTRASLQRFQDRLENMSCLNTELSGKLGTARSKICELTERATQAEKARAAYFPVLQAAHRRAKDSASHVSKITKLY